MTSSQESPSDGEKKKYCCNCLRFDEVIEAKGYNSVSPQGVKHACDIKVFRFSSSSIHDLHKSLLLGEALSSSQIYFSQPHYFNLQKKQLIVKKSKILQLIRAKYMDFDQVVSLL